MILISRINNISEKYKNFYKYIILTDTINDINTIYRNFDHYQDFIHSIIFRSTVPLIFSGIRKDFDKIPLIIFSSELGSIKMFLKNIELYKIHNVKCLLSSGKKENFLPTKIISSLDINTGIYFDERTDWNNLYELIKYTVNKKKLNAELLPITYIINNYRNKEIDFNDAYFDNSLNYLYINKENDIFLNYRDFINNKPFTKITDDDLQSVSVKISNHIEEKKKMLLADLNECSTCAAWKICLGKFCLKENKKNTCSKCFTLLIDNLLTS